MAASRSAATRRRRRQKRSARTLIPRTRNAIPLERPRKFEVGQAVRLRTVHGSSSNRTAIYLITDTLPPKGIYPQYRIKSEGERYERITTQDNLVPVADAAKDVGGRAMTSPGL